MARRRRQGRRDFEPSAEAQQMLREDYPPAVKTAVLLSAKGGRRPKARCLVCRSQGIHYQVWIPAALLHVEPGKARPQRYVLCTPCWARHAAGTLTHEAIGALLAQR